MDELSIALIALNDYPRKVFREIFAFTPARISVFLLLAAYALRVLREGDR